MVEPGQGGKGSRTNTLRRFTVSSLKTNRAPRRIADFGTRAKDAAAQGVHGARGWAAPRLEDAAEAVTASVAPRVSAALRSTARQVRPEGTRSGKAGLRRLLGWRWLLGAGAAIAAAGASAALAMRRRYASATAEIRDAADSPDDESAPGHQTADDDTAPSEVNGSGGRSRRVSKSRR
jgi:hypothetical protein